MKIYVIGGPGSGKTTLARELAELTGASFFPLDDHAWYWPDGGLKTPSELGEVVDQVLAEKDWVAEGIYHGWTDPLIDSADMVVWLDPPWPIALWRALLRHIKADLRRNNRHPGYWRLMKFLIQARSYYVESAEEIDTSIDWTRSTTEPYVERLGDRMVRLARMSASEVLALVGRRYSGV